MLCMAIQEIRLQNDSRLGLMCLMVFVIPMFTGVLWFLYPFREGGPYPFVVLWYASLVGFPLSLWQLYVLATSKYVLTTRPDGLVVGLWIRRILPWKNIKDIGLSEVKLTGGLKKRWSAARPYRQSLVIRMHDSRQMEFENILHRIAHILSFSRNEIRLPLKLVSIQNNDTLCQTIRERWSLALSYLK